MNARRASRRAGRLARCAGAAAIVSLASCQSTGSRLPEETISIADSSVLQRLLQRAETDRGRAADARAPSDAARWSVEGWETLDTPNIRADETELSLEEAVARSAGDAVPHPPTPAMNAEALKRYAAGRAALFAGDMASAIAEFTAAHQADPASPEPLRDLGEAHVVRGEYPEAIRAFEKTLERDPASLRALEQLGRHALRTGDPERAAAMLARAWREMGEGADEAVRAIVAVEMGRAYAATGRWLAGAEALRIAASTPDEVASPRWADHASLVRQRPEVLRMAGDLFARAGRWNEARAAFDGAFALAPQSSDALVERRVVTALRAGSPAGATRALVETCLGRTLEEGVGWGFRASPETVRLIERVARTASSRPSLEASLLAAVGTLTPEQRSEHGSDIALALAASQESRDARRTLRARLEAAPADDRALDALLARATAESADEGASVASELAGLRPEDARRIARAFLLHAPSYEAARDAVSRRADRRRDDAGARLVLGEIALPVSPDVSARAASEAEALLTGREMAALSLRARSHALQGMFEEVDATLARIDTGSEAGRRARGEALEALGRPAMALETLQPDLAPDAGAGLRTLLLGASLALQVDDAGLAERLLHRAIAAHPGSLEAHEALVTALLARRPQAREDADDLTEQVRDAARALREAAAWSVGLGRLFARDLMGQKQWSDAIARLKSVLEQRPDDREALAMLLASARQAGAVTEQEEWISEWAAKRPDLSMWLTARAFVLAESDRVAEAVGELQAALDVRPHDGEISRTLEDLLRTRVGDPTRADALALARLARAPKSAESRVELAETLIRAKRPAEALREVQELLDGPALRDGLVARLVNVGLAASAGVDSEAAPSAEGLEIVELLAQRLPTIPEALHRRRILALVRAGADVERLRDAARTGARQHPSLAGDAYLLALDELIQAGRPQDALTLASEAAKDPKQTRPSLMASWVLLAISARDGASAEEACRAAITSGRVPEVLASLGQIAPALRTDGVPAPDELAFIVASAFGSMGLDDDADRLYTLALEHNPDHPWSNNNLGYRWLDDPTKFAEAYWMIVRAHQFLPDEPAVIDSMGWARYLAGIFEDKLLPDARAPVEGAVTLLQRAADSMLDAPDPEVYEHLGDALFRAERTDEARKAWEQALALVRQMQARADAAPNISIRTIDALRARSERLHKRLDALIGGQDPPVPPIIGHGAQPPRPARQPLGPVS
ncbi:MAG: tetratricopeptide repeat protein [Phycisphaerales bacterium]